MGLTWTRISTQLPVVSKTKKNLTTFKMEVVTEFLPINMEIISKAVVEQNYR